MVHVASPVRLHLIRLCNSPERLLVLQALAEGPGRPTEIGRRIGVDSNLTLRHLSALQGVGATRTTSAARINGYVWEIDTDTPAGRLALALVRFIATEESGSGA